MNYLKMILAITLVFNMAIATAQQEAYVTADNGLTIREKPDVRSEKLGKLQFGEALQITEETDVELVIIDDGEKVIGNWVKIETSSKTGYVFNGYLSPHDYTKGIEIHHKGLEVRLKNLKSNDESVIYPLFEKDSATVHVEVGQSPEGKPLVLKNNRYKHVSIFQRYENSFSFMSADAKCDTNVWKQFDTEWKPLKQLKLNTFETLTFTESDWKVFIETAIKNSRAAVIDQCGEDWLTYISTIKNINNIPVSVTTNRVFIKFILTDSEDNITEKIIEFKMPNDA